MKTVNTRDAAAASLRKIGLDKTHYNKFITKNGDKFVVDMKAAEEFKMNLATDAYVPAAKPKAATRIKLTKSVDAKDARLADKARKANDANDAKKAKAAAKPAKKAATAKKTKVVAVDRKVTEKPTEKEKKSRGKYIRRLISLGYTNSEVWTDIKAVFELDDSKKYYPGWYRFDMRRQGFDV
jgi:hypothetical protein